jgi:hypothetical protein
MFSAFDLSSLAGFALLVLVQGFVVSTIPGILETSKKFGISSNAALVLSLVLGRPL